VSIRVWGPGADRLASSLTASEEQIAPDAPKESLKTSLLPASDVPTDASFIFALYAAARTIPLAATTLVAIYKRSESALQVLGTLAGIVQMLDAGVGLYQHDLGKSIGPLFIAVLQFLALYLLNRPVRASVD
jgi:hypothetical protein